MVKHSYNESKSVSLFVSENTWFIEPVSPSTDGLNPSFKSVINAEILVSNAVILSESDGADTGAGAGSDII